jgi:tRNA A37 threonylcarbamoyladenosine biosynthesis protein TsaE
MTRKYTLEEVPTIAAELLEQFGAGRVYALEGDLGAGKTTLVAADVPSVGGGNAYQQPNVQHRQ